MRTRQPLVLELVLAILLGACNAAAEVPSTPGESSARPSHTVTPSPRIAPTPRPTPSPPDVARPFLRHLAEADGGTVLDVTGTLTYGAAELVISGRVRARGADSEMRIEIASAGHAQTTETVSIGGDVFNRTDGGPWIIAEADGVRGSADQSLGTFLQGLTNARDVGVVSIDGRHLHRIEIDSSGVDPAMFGIGGTGRNNAEVGVDLYAQDDGRPSLMVVRGTWQEARASSIVEASLELNFAFARLGSVTIRRPDDVWEMYHSESKGYRTARPEGWTVVESEDEDAFGVDGDDLVWIARVPISRGTDADELERLMAEEFRSKGGRRLESKPITLGGVAGYLDVYGLDGESGEELRLYDAMTVRKGFGWEIYSMTTPEWEAEDRPFFEQWISTFAFAD